MTRPTGIEAEIERLRAELERTKSELHRPRGDGLSVGEHIALVQRAQGIAKTDHAALVRAQRELAEARAEIKRLRRRSGGGIRGGRRATYRLTHDGAAGS
jgi:chromosome segregation ATPase